MSIMLIWMLDIQLKHLELLPVVQQKFISLRMLQLMNFGKLSRMLKRIITQWLDQVDKIQCTMLPQVMLKHWLVELNLRKLMDLKLDSSRWETHGEHTNTMGHIQRIVNCGLTILRNKLTSMKILMEFSTPQSSYGFTNLKTSQLDILKTGKLILLQETKKFLQRKISMNGFHLWIPFNKMSWLNVFRCTRDCGLKQQMKSARLNLNTHN